MPAGYGWKLHQVLVPAKFIATASSFIAVLMCLDGVEDNVLASLRPNYQQSTYTSIDRSARAALGLGILCILICMAGLLVGYTTHKTLAAFVQIPLHSAAAALYLYTHFASLHYARFWHVFFVFVLPPTLMEVVLIAKIRASKKISW
ncbi:hypothetical protein DIPPA_10472 [Diplonema papillatum]|nr:hypothetical protein DIPPA_10472 [Diplonema papillatum]